MWKLSCDFERFLLGFLRTFNCISERRKFLNSAITIYTHTNARSHSTHTHNVLGCCDNTLRTKWCDLYAEYGLLSYSVSLLFLPCCCCRVSQYAFATIPIKWAKFKFGPVLRWMMPRLSSSIASLLTPRYTALSLKFPITVRPINFTLAQAHRKSLCK